MNVIWLAGACTATWKVELFLNFLPKAPQEKQRNATEPKFRFDKAWCHPIQSEGFKGAAEAHCCYRAQGALDL